MKNFPLEGVVAVPMQISASPMLVCKHRHRRMRLLWHSSISEVCMKNAKALTVATLLPNITKQDQCAVILFWAAKKQKSVDIHRRM